MQIGIGRLLVVVIAVGVAFAGIGAALADGGQDDGGQPVQLAGDDARKNDVDDSAAVVDDDDDDGNGDDDTGDGNTRGNDTNGATGTGTGSGNPSQAAVLVEGRTAAQWMRSAGIYKQRWLRTKRANDRHASQVRNLRASLNVRASRNQARAQVRQSPTRRVARGGGGGGTNSGGGGTGGSGGGDT
jgi:hypothetical protein